MSNIVDPTRELRDDIQWRFLPKRNASAKLCLHELLEDVEAHGPDAEYGEDLEGDDGRV